MTILVTGAAGFIGATLCKRLLHDGHEVVGLDNFNDYYDPQLKHDRVTDVQQYALEQNKPNFKLKKLGLSDKDGVEQLFKEFKPTAVVNLAAQAGVRRSLQDPTPYIESNIVGFTNILEACRYHNVGHLVYASSSSVYGANTDMPFSVHKPADHPLSLYAATKRANELFAHSYSHLFNIPTTGLRFFTVYGPWGRPDMALFSFTKAILNGETINVYNNGEHQRDFTYIDDIVEGIVQVIANPPQGNPNWSGKNPEPASSTAPWRLYNIGNSKPVQLMTYITALEKSLGIAAKKNFLPLQPGDVPATWADTKDLLVDFGYVAKTEVAAGIEQFVAWYKKYYSQKH